MNKKFLIGTIGLLFLCLSSQTLSSTPIPKGQLTIWVSVDKGYKGIAKVAAKFEQETGVKVTVDHFDQLTDRFERNASYGGGPDILLWANDRYGEWVKKELLDEIDVPNGFKDRFFDVTWDAMSVNGKIYGYPFALEAISLICNKDLVPHVPKTFEEFEQLDAKLTKQGKHAILWDYNNIYYSYPLISANGGYSFYRNEDGTYDTSNVGVNNEGTKTGLNYIIKMVNNGHMEKDVTYASMESQFIDGKIGCIITGAWGWRKYSNINYTVNEFPTLNGKAAKPFVGVLGLVINKATPNKDLANKFLQEYLLTDEGYEEVNNDILLGASALISYESKLEKDPRVVTLMANVKNGQLMPNIPEMYAFWSSLGSAFKSAISGKQSVDEALKTAEERMLRQH